MITVRKSDQRGKGQHGWLDSRHTFSFAEYHDPAHMGFRTLRVINEDVVAPGMGFGMHPHRDMEILTWVVEGSLTHQDSLGNRGDLVPGMVQRMSAGRGIRHSEMNGSETAPVHLLQIWILPNVSGAEPRYEDRVIDPALLTNRLHPIASGYGEGGEALSLYQDAAVYAGRLDAGVTAEAALPGRHGWVQVVRGTVAVNGTALQAGDGAALTDEERAVVAAESNAEVLVFSLS